MSHGHNSFHPVKRLASLFGKTFLQCLVCLSLLTFTLQLQAKRIYVSPTGLKTTTTTTTNADGTTTTTTTTTDQPGDGTSWDSPMTLVNALTTAQSGDEIWVLGFQSVTTRKQCYIVPAELVETGFVVPVGVKLYGGFSGTETKIEDRKTEAKSFAFVYHSVLSGDIQINDTVDPSELIYPSNTFRSDNAEHVLTVLTHKNATTEVDGFTFTGGQSDGSNGRGGGMYIKTKDGSEGGGAYHIDKCYFVKNYAKIGGAVYVEEDAGTTDSYITHSSFFNNVAGTRSSGENSAGGVCIAGTGRLGNSAVLNNDNGGVLISANAYIVNATIACNAVAAVGYFGNVPGGTIRIYNTVLWGNTNLYSGDTMPGFSYCGFPECPKEGDANHNVYVSQKNMDSNGGPLFISPATVVGFDYITNENHDKYFVWDYSIPYNSGLVDKGAKPSVTQSDLDLAGNPRVAGDGYDIGAYEYQRPTANRVRFVRKDAPAGGDGSSWEKAMNDIQDAIDALHASGGYGEVWVAKGKYQPTKKLVTDNDATICFRIRDGINVFGGFEGTETSKTQRKKKDGGMPWEFENETILQGNGYDGTTEWNKSDSYWNTQSQSRHVVWMTVAPNDGYAAFRITTSLDGFTIEGGNATNDGDQIYHPGKGAGVYMGARSILSNCIIRNNTATISGGGVFMNTGQIISCCIYNNSVKEGDGGGVFMDNSGLISRCQISNNTAQNGSGVYLSQNRAADDGGLHPEYLYIESSVVSNNNSQRNGAVYCSGGGYIMQSTIANNQTSMASDASASDATQTGGLYIDRNATVINSILWNNHNANKAVPMYAKNPTKANVRFLNTAVSHTDKAVWNNITRNNFIELSAQNTGTDVGLMNPFFDTSKIEEHLSATLPGATPEDKKKAADEFLATKYGVQTDRTAINFYWNPVKGSPLRGQGLPIGMFPETALVKPEIDLMGRLFAQKPSLGASYVEMNEIHHQVVDSKTWRLYVHNSCIDPSHDGSSWTKAYRSLNEALAYFGERTEAEAAAAGVEKFEIYVQEHQKTYPKYYHVNDDPMTATIYVPKTVRPITVKGSFSSAKTEGDENRVYMPTLHRSVVDGNPDAQKIENGLYHCFTVTQGARLTLQGFHIVNGYALNATQYVSGGGMLVMKDATVNLRDCLFENNTAHEGAAVDAKQATVNMVNCVVNNNTCDDETTAAVIAKELTLNHVTFANNKGGTYALSNGGRVSSVHNILAVCNTSGNTELGGETITIEKEGEHFLNPTISQGATLGFNTRLGGYSSFRPLTSSTIMSHYVINKGTNADATLATNRLDFIHNERDLGGAEDLGAYEADLPKSGRIYYVRTDGNDNNDGLSWEKAVKTIRVAVNKAKVGEVIDNERPQVWVAAGTYQQDPEYETNGWGSINDKKSPNCFVIEDGVNVFGAFPKTGAPGMKDRHPLLSQYIYNNTNGAYRDEDYETILQPLSNSYNRRVLGQADDYNPCDRNINHKDFNYATTWDGFTIRNGYLNTNGLSFSESRDGYARNGGAGAILFKNTTLTNCIIYNNTNTSDNTDRQLRGAGVYCDGGTIVNCYILNNTLGSYSNSNSRIYTAYGGGAYIMGATVYNCIFSKNQTKAVYGDGAGVFIDGVSTFFNNTITDNSCDVSKRGNGGICIWDSDKTVANLTIYNCISINNTGFIIKDDKLQGNKDIASDGGKVACYYSLFKSLSSTGNRVTFETGCKALNTTNEADIFVDAKAEKPNYRLSKNADNYALNTGLNVPTITDVNGTTTTYNLFNFTDMDYKARIQDCTIDVGAFERDNSDLIKAENDGDRYVYYVSYEGEGTASGNSPQNAACEMKLQSVLTAAGKQVATDPDAKVIVKIAGYEWDENGQGAVNVYHAHTLYKENNPRSYTFVVPYGVTVEGGWNDYITDEKGQVTMNSFTENNPSKYITTLSAVATVNEQEVKGFHTVLFSAKPSDGWDETSTANPPTIIDGLYLTGGSATSMAGEIHPNTKGGGAMVPSWAHVRRCVVYGNEAVQGGGLYLLPGAMVSGTVVHDNEAQNGAGIYASATDDVTNPNTTGGTGASTATANADLRAHIFVSTIAANTATQVGGGIMTEDGASIGFGLAVHGNKANSDKDMSGVFDNAYEDNLMHDMVVAVNTTPGEARDINTMFYPYTNCFVESYDMPSDFENNEALESEKSLYFNDYYTLKQFSRLIKSGIMAKYYEHLINTHNLSAVDIQGLSYIQEGMERIDAGAYAFSGGTMQVDINDVITNLFVNKNVRQPDQNESWGKNIGVSFYTPLNEISDALEYIRKARADMKTAGKEEARFNIFVAGGTYKPNYRRQAAQTQGVNQRQNSFLIPPGVNIYGGFSGSENYSAGIKDPSAAEVNANPEVTGQERDRLEPLTDANFQTFLDSRVYSDYNGNGIREPWEMANQVILSGKVNSLTDSKNVYHVVYSNSNEPDQTTTNFKEVLLDGITITEGETINEINMESTNELGRGGGIYTSGVNYILNRCRIINNRGVCGNAVFARNSNITAIGSIFAGNNTVEDEIIYADPNENTGQSTTTGGAKAIFLNEETELNSGRIDIGGGAIYLSGFGSDNKLTAINCLWVNNETRGTGGVIGMRPFTATTQSIEMVNNTIAKNKARTIAIANVNNVKLTNTLIWGNQQTEGEYVAFANSDSGTCDANITHSASDYELTNDDANNKNIKLNALDNMEVDGPRFRRPSSVAGAAGHNSTSQWNPAAISVLADAGTGQLNVKTNPVNEISGAYQEMVYRLSGSTTGDNGTETYLIPEGIKSFTADQYLNPDTKDYVRYAGPLDEEGNPEDKVIDIGLYEFQYELDFGKMDKVYIATFDSGSGDGTSWDNASSDLRGAIIALSHPTGNSSTDPSVMADKTIYVKKGEYDYAISQLFADKTAFNLTMSTSTAYSNKLIIKGAYNEQGVQDFSNPSVISCNPVNGANTQTLMQINANAKDVIIEGFRITNPYGTGITAGASQFTTETGETAQSGTVTLRNMELSGNKAAGIKASNTLEGNLLVVNTLFADNNRGNEHLPTASTPAPSIGLDFTDNVGNDKTEKITVVNATFANNDQDIQYVEGNTPKIYNTVSWNNTTQKLANDETNKNVSFTAGQANDAILDGPNFVDPLNADKTKRSYRLRPSVKLLNQGSSVLYKEHTGYDSSSPDKNPEYGKELASIDRIIDKSIDVGAYEYPLPLSPVVYVKAGLASGRQDGSDWENATGDLQGAADCAVTYSYQNTDNATGTHKTGYVFVHNNVAEDRLQLKLGGAKIYGNMNDEAPLHAITAESADEAVRATVKDLLGKRRGMMETNAHSKLNGLSIKPHTVEGMGQSVVDGFEVTGVVDLSDGMLSSSIVRTEGNTLNVRKGGILYNSFVDGAVHADKGSEVVNVTLTGKLTKETATPEGGTTPVEANVRKESPTVNDYVTTDVWKYQLNEMSPDINGSSVTDISKYTALAGHERDLAGNPRILDARVDNGCMETWRVPAGGTWKTALDGKYYPLDGSVVYLQEGANFVLDEMENFRPGYLLVGDKASLYGQQSNVQVPYIGVEKNVKAGVWDMMAIPYDQTRDNITYRSYNENGLLNLAAIASTDSTETYDGQRRANSLYQYYADDSKFWNSATAFSAGTGFAVMATQTGTIRFTAQGNEENPIAYAEDNTPKTVTLTQYDQRTVNADGTPNFTYKENMGWNLMGIPYLVNDYDLTGMDIPHVVYPYKDQAYQTIRTWDEGSSTTGSKTASTTGGIFTQTAVIGSSETVKFPRPVYTETPAETSVNKYRLFLTGETGEDAFAFGTTAEDDGDGEFDPGCDGLKLMARDKRRPQVYATGGSGTRFSLMDVIGMESSVNIGVKTTAGEYLLSLGETADYDMAEEVWLTDRRTGRTVNLRETDYLFSSEASEDVSDRFELSFSRMAKERGTVNIYTRGSMLYVEGVEAGRTINVYNTGGSLIHSAQSDGGIFSVSLPRGIYVVNTSAAATRKVLVR